MPARARRRSSPRSWSPGWPGGSGIAVPDLALIEVDPEIGRREPDEEVQELVTASAGLNLAVDFLPGAVGYDRSFAVDREVADRIVWLDAFVANVDRSARNTNLLIWHKSLWAIDHGACLRFHHAWGRRDAFATAPYDYGDHVLGGLGRPRQVHDALAAEVTGDAAGRDPGRRPRRVAGARPDASRSGRAGGPRRGPRRVLGVSAGSARRGRELAAGRSAGREAPP